jgi:hypothetical protein
MLFRALRVFVVEAVLCFRDFVAVFSWPALPEHRASHAGWRYGNA